MTLEDTEPVAVLWNECPAVLIQALLADTAINTAWLTLLAVGSVTRALGTFKTQIDFVTTTFVSSYAPTMSPDAADHWLAHTNHSCSPLPCVQAWFRHDPEYSSYIYNSLQVLPVASLELARLVLAALDWSVQTCVQCDEFTNRYGIMYNGWGRQARMLLQYQCDLDAQTLALHQKQLLRAQRHALGSAAPSAAPMTAPLNDVGTPATAATAAATATAAAAATATTVGTPATAATAAAAGTAAAAATAATVANAHQSMCHYFSAIIQEGQGALASNQTLTRASHRG